MPRGIAIGIPRRSARALGVGFSDLLRQADDQEWSEDTCDQREISVGKDLFIDPPRSVREIPGEGLKDGSLEKQVQARKHDDGYASQAGGGHDSWLSGAAMGDTQVKPQVQRHSQQNQNRCKTGILPILW